MKLRAVVLFLFALISSAQSATPRPSVLECLRELQRLDLNFLLFREDGPLEIPDHITTQIFRDALAAPIPARDLREIRALFQDRTVLDQIYVHAVREVGDKVFGSGYHEPHAYRVRPEETHILSQEEYDFIVRELTNQYHDRRSLTSIRHPSFLWYGYLSLAQGTEQMPQFVDHIMDTEWVDIPSRLEAKLEGTAGFDAWTFMRAKRAAIFSATADRYDYFSQERIPVHYAPSLTQSVQRFESVIDSLVAIIRNPESPVIYRKPDGSMSYRPDFHSTATSSSAALLHYVAENLPRLSTQDPEWKTAWPRLIEKTMDAVDFRHTTGCSDFASDLPCSDSLMVSPRARANFLRALLARPEGLDRTKKIQWMIQSAGIDDLTKQIAAEVEAMDHHGLVIAPEGGLPLKMVDYSPNVRMELWMGALSEILVEICSVDFDGASEVRTALLVQMQTPGRHTDVFPLYRRMQMSRP